MVFLDLTLPTPAENLACDEALLDRCDSCEGTEVLRVWEPTSAFVVLGYANRADLEANLPACQTAGIPVLRRISGGGAVLQAPGVLNYSLVLRTDRNTLLGSTGGTNTFVMEPHRTVLERLLGTHVSREGATDLVVDGRKVSGNAQRRKLHALLFHGTFLLNAPVELMERCLRMPSRAPDYRAGRAHRCFVTSVAAHSADLKDALRRVWHAVEPASVWPRAETVALVQSRYGLKEWNFKL